MGSLSRLPCVWHGGGDGLARAGNRGCLLGRITFAFVLGPSAEKSCACCLWYKGTVLSLENVSAKAWNCVEREMYLLLVVEEFIIAEAWSSDYLP
jgi:hypothetical protein